MTPIEVHPRSDRATATLQAMRDAATLAEGREVPPYDGPDPDTYQRIRDEWVADLTAPEVRSPVIGMRIRYG